MYTPNTFHAYPLTVRQLRPNDSSAPARPITISGMISDQNVSRIRPGTMIRMNPIPMPMLARMEATATEPMNGIAAERVARRSRSTRPSRTSCTASTSADCSRNMANSVKISPMNAPAVPSPQLSSALMTAITR